MINATRYTYFSPYDDLQAALLSLIDSAEKKIRIADFSFNLDPLVEKLIEKHNQGVDVKLILDKSQSGGVSEKPEVVKVKAAGIPTMIGTSEKHKIMHLKVAIIDNNWVLSGSYNFTLVAEEENNYFDVEHSLERGLMFNTNWQKVWDFIQNNEN